MKRRYFCTANVSLITQNQQEFLCSSGNRMPFVMKRDSFVCVGCDVMMTSESCLKSKNHIIQLHSHSVSAKYGLQPHWLMSYAVPFCHQIDINQPPGANFKSMEKCHCCNVSVDCQPNPHLAHCSGILFRLICPNCEMENPRSNL